MILTLYDIKNNPKMEIAPSDSSICSKAVQSDNVLSLSFVSYECKTFDVNDYIDFCGERFWATDRYTPKQKSTVEWEYDIKLYGIESLIKHYLVVKLTNGDNETEFSYTATAYDHVALIVQNINAGMETSDWKVGEVVASEYLDIDYKGIYCNEGLKKVAGLTGVEYWIEGTTVNVSRCEHSERITLGYEKGLTSLYRDKADNVKFFTRLFPIGTTRNIAYDAYGYSRLQLPGGVKFIDQDTDKFGVVHHYEKEAFAHIYPRRIGKISSVRSEEVKGENGKPFTIYYFKDSSLNFNPNEYEMNGLVKTISFQDNSSLAGRDFEVNYNDKTKEFEIITQWPYDNDIQLPNEQLSPKVLDEYILWNIKMPIEYYALAEAEFKKAVEEFMEKQYNDVSVYKAHTDYIDIAERGLNLTIGQRVRLEHAEYFAEGYRDSRITKITRKVVRPTDMDIEISDVLSKGALEKVDDNIADVSHYTKVATGGFPDVIKSWENTLPTDTNVFSSRRSKFEFLSRKNDDTANGKITFNKGLTSVGLGVFESGLVADLAEIREIITDSLLSREYTPGVLGSGYSLTRNPETGRSKLEVDDLTVRIKAVFREVIIEQLKHVGAGLVISPARMVCSRVEELADSYRCYFEAKDGDKEIVNQFVAGDQAAHLTSNLKSGNNIANRYYWRLVTGTGDNYIDLSKTDCAENSDIPAAGDDIYHQGNREDVTRQNVIILSAYGDDSPSIKQYFGIDSFSLIGKEVLVLSPYGNKIIGELYLSSGENVGNALASNSTEIGGVSNSLAQFKFDQNGLNITINQRITTAQNTADLITTRFQTFTAANGTFESKISETKSYADSVGGQTRSWVQSQNYSTISQTADAIRLEVNSLNIIGENLVRDSKYMEARVGDNGMAYLGSVSLTTGKAYIFACKSNSGSGSLCFNTRIDGDSSTALTVAANTPFTTTRSYMHVWAVRKSGAIHPVGSKIFIEELKLEEGSRSTAWTPSPDDSPAISRNLINGTANPALSVAKWNKTATYAGAMGVDTAQNALKFTATNGWNTFYYNLPDAIGKTVTVSGWFKRVNRTSAIGFNTHANRQGVTYPVTANTADWTYNAVTFTIANNSAIQLYYTGNSTVAESFLVRELQVEYGSKATAWTPSPDETVVNRNLLSGTKLPYLSVKNWSKTESCLGGYTIDTPQNAFSFTAFNGWNTFYYNLPDAIGKTVTVSGWFKRVNGSSPIGINNTDNRYGVTYLMAANATDWTYNAVTYTIEGNSAVQFCIFMPDFGTPESVLVRELQVEYGSKATAWTPSKDEKEQALVRTGIDIETGKITLDAGNVIVTGNFFANKILTYGVNVADKFIVSADGSFTSTKGRIGGFEIGETDLLVNNGNRDGAIIFEKVRQGSASIRQQRMVLGTNQNFFIQINLDSYLLTTKMTGIYINALNGSNGIYVTTNGDSNTSVYALNVYGRTKFEMTYNGVGAPFTINLGTAGSFVLASQNNPLAYTIGGVKRYFGVGNNTVEYNSGYLRTWISNGITYLILGN